MNKELLKRIFSSLIILPLVIFLVIKGSFFFNTFIIICFLISSYEWFKMAKKKLHKYLGFIFLIMSFYLTYHVRFSLTDSYIYFFLVLFICISTDLGGYIFGKLIKGPKLTRISPNKTYAGMLGSFILPILVFYLFSINPYIYQKYSISLEIFIFILTVSGVSQFGDIAISYFKRTSNIKDTGKIIPGHGGLLDRIDGMIFAFPFSYFLILLFSIEII